MNPHYPASPFFAAAVFVRAVSRTAVAGAILSSVVLVSQLWADNVLIPLPSRRDMVFDRASGHLYITTADGWVRPFNIVTGELESGYSLGGSLYGVDIAPDDSVLLIAQNEVSATEGTFHKLDLSTGAVTDIHYTLDTGLGESGGWDVAIDANGLALVTTKYPGSGPVPLRQINLADNSVTVRDDILNGVYQGKVAHKTQLHRSADRTLIYLLESFGGIPFPVETYSAVTDSFSPSRKLGVSETPAVAAVNRDGSLLGSGRDRYIGLDETAGFGFKHTYNGFDSGIAFDAVTDTLYAIDSATDQVVAFDTVTFAEKFRFAIGEDIPLNDSIYTYTAGQFDTGTLVSSQDGRYLAIETPLGVRLISVPKKAPAPPLLKLGTAHGMVFDKSGTHLYLATTTGLVWSYNLVTGGVEPPYQVGGSLNGIDITPDDSFLLVADSTTGIGEDVFHKVDLRTREVTHLTYLHEVASFQNGTWDAAIASNGHAMITGQTGSSSDLSGTSPLHDLDLLTNKIVSRPDVPGIGGKGLVEERTLINRSADRSRLLFSEPNDPRGPVFIYNAATDKFGPPKQLMTFMETANTAISRDGAFVQARAEDSALFFSSDFQLLHLFQGQMDSGVAFDAVLDLTYGVVSTTDEIIAYDTNTFAEKLRVPIGEDVPSTPPPPGPPNYFPPDGQFAVGTLAASQDSRYLALLAPKSIRVIDLLQGTSRTVPATYQPTLGLANLSTRMHVGTGDNVMIGGFIVTGTQPKKVLIRALGPSLPLAGVLANPVVELRDSSGVLIASNDDWRSDQEEEIKATTIPPGNDLEAAIVATLPANNAGYTAIVSGNDNGTGIGLVELYDLNQNPDSKFANISTRGVVQSGDNSLIAGTILAGPTPRTVLIRAIGPSLPVTGKLADPTLELHDGNGTLLRFNDNWRSDQEAEIAATGIPPQNDRESAMVETLPANGAGYTAVMRGANGTTGVALVEVYSLD